MQLGRKIKLSCHNPHRRSTTVQKLNLFIHTLFIIMAAAGARPKATKINLINSVWSRNLPKTQHTSYVYTLTLLKYFSSVLHNIILSLSNDPISYTSGDYFSYLQVCLSLYTLNLRDESQKHNQQAFLVFEIIGDNELLWGRERAPCDFPFLSFLYSKGMWLQRMFLSSLKSFSQKKLIK